MRYESDKIYFDSDENINIVIGPNGCGKSYLLDLIEAANIGYYDTMSPNAIYKKYFAEFFETESGDGYEQIQKICHKLGSKNEYIFIKNPENFLHIVVQEALMDAVHDMFDGTPVKVFVETHSPSIICDHFEDVHDVNKK